MLNQQKQGCIVITGSSKGIGFGLAKAFLTLGKSVVISGRNQQQLDQAYSELSQQFQPQRVHAVQCDICQTNDLEKLWDEAIQQFSQVDIWINNAATCPPTKDFIDTSTQDIATAIQTNILGTLFAAQIAAKGMIKQGFGKIYHMEGWGSRGEWSAGTTVYAITKRAVSYFSKALYKELKSTNIIIGTLNPGMVATDLLISSWQNGEVKHWKKMRRLFFFIIDPPDIVCPYLAEQMLKNHKNNIRIVWMTPLRLISRFLQPYYWRRNPVKNTALDHLN